MKKSVLSTVGSSPRLVVFGTRSALVALALVSAFSVQAQTTGSTTTSQNSGNSGSRIDSFSTMASDLYAPGSRYIGFNAGRSNYSLGDGVGNFFNDRRNNAYNLYTGSFTRSNIGAELGYTDFGRIGRAGGISKAQGFNLSVVGRLPVGEMFNVLGKVGTTYSQTDVTSGFNAGIATGREKGFGLSYGVGAELVFAPNISAVVQYDSHNLKFAGGRERVSATTVGLRYRF